MDNLKSDKLQEDKILQEMLEQFSLSEILLTLGECFRVQNKEMRSFKEGEPYILKRQDRRILERGRDMLNTFCKITRKHKNGVCTKNET